MSAIYVRMQMSASHEDALEVAKEADKEIARLWGFVNSQDARRLELEAQLVRARESNVKMGNALIAALRTLRKVTDELMDAKEHNHVG